MIHVNDKFEVEWQEGMTVTRLLDRLKFSYPLVIVSIDGVLVPKDEYTVRQIPDGADVKVLHMTAGG
jgi:thiamine biosynthesis protein ThiS